jgi:hypothetical protein
VLGRFHGIPSSEVGLYLLPFAAGNFAGPLVLGRLFDTWGRRPMIAATYALSGLLLALTAMLFVAGLLDAATQTLAWTACSSSRRPPRVPRTSSSAKAFPSRCGAGDRVLLRARHRHRRHRAPWLFGALIGTGDPIRVAWGYALGAVLMLMPPQWRCGSVSQPSASRWRKARAPLSFAARSTTGDLTRAKLIREADPSLARAAADRAISRAPGLPSSISKHRSSVSSSQPAHGLGRIERQCGDRITLSIACKDASGWFDRASGSSLKTSSAAPPRCPRCKRVHERGFVDSAPRDTLTSVAPGFIAAISRAPIRCSVCGVSTACMETMSHCCKHRLEIIAPRYTCARHRVAIDVRIEAEHLHPEPLAAMRATDVPIRPTPTSPSVFAREIRCKPSRRGPCPAAFLHFALQRFELPREREHQRDRALGDRLLRVFGNVDDGNAPRARSDDVDGVDADAVLHDAAQARRALDGRGRDVRIAREQQVGVAQLEASACASAVPGKKHERGARVAQHPIDARDLELRIGADDLRSRPAPVHTIRGRVAVRRDGPLPRCRVRDRDRAQSIVSGGASTSTLPCPILNDSPFSRAR